VSGDPNADTITFKYDPFGRRIEKNVSTYENGVPTAYKYTYVYDNEDIILEVLERTQSGNTTTTTTAYTHGPGIDEPLSLERSGQTYYYHADGLGSVTSMTDSTQAVVNRYAYDSFGAPKSSETIRNAYAYTGREYDSETGLYYYRARYYDPEAGRFAGKDPIGFAGGDVNVYGYTANSPVNRVDPMGLTWVEYDSFSDTVTVHPGDFATFGPGMTFPAGNNAQKNSRGKWNPGFYWFDYWVSHAGGPNSRYGSNGNFVFHMPNCVGCGVHSGRQDSCDQANRCGVKYATLGCIRTTDDATSMLKRLHQDGDPVILLLVK
jgi:RHS repeat-associated protein